jgi:catechol 2,3-dioxygenase-like lactoylglutathione lyase family enzyme
MKLSPYSVAVVVSNGEKAVAFYTKKLGLDLLADDGHWRVVGRKRVGLKLHLCEHGKPTPKSEKGNTGIMILADGPMMKTYQKLKKNGVKFSVPPEKTEWGWHCRFLDPDGNEFWLGPDE